MLRTDDASGHGSLRSEWPHPGREPHMIAACTRRRENLGRYRAKGEEKAGVVPAWWGGTEASPPRVEESGETGRWERHQAILMLIPGW